MNIKSLEEIDEETRRRRSVAAGFTAGIGTAGYLANQARDAFIQTPEAITMAKGQARDLWKKLRPEVDAARQALYAAEIGASGEYKATRGKILRTMQDVYEGLQEAKMDQGIAKINKDWDFVNELKNIMNEGHAHIKDLKEHAKKIKDVTGHPKSGGGGQYHNYQRTFDRAKSKVKQYADPKSLKETTGLYQYMTPGTAAKALGAAALAGGLYYAGSRMMAPKYEDSE